MAAIKAAVETERNIELFGFTIKIPLVNIAAKRFAGSQILDALYSPKAEKRFTYRTA